MKRTRILHQIMMLAMVGFIAGTTPVNVLAEEGFKPEPVAERIPVSENSSDSADKREISADSYEIYETSGSNSPDVLKKGRQAKIVVYVKAEGIRTKDIAKGGIEISKLPDSFSFSGSIKPKVNVTSAADDDLEYAVTFSKVTYRGKGDELRFRVNYKKPGISSDIITANIAECQEYSASDGGGDDGDITGQPVIKIKRSSPLTPVGPGEPFTLTLELQNTSTDSDIEDLVVSVNPGISLFITEDTNSRLIQRLNSKKSAQIQMDMTAGQELSGPSQTLELELKYNYYSSGRLTAGSSSQKVLLPVKGGSGTSQPYIRVVRGDLEGPVHAGQVFSVGIHLENTSKERELRNLIVVFEPNDQIALLEQTDTKLLGNLAAGQGIDFNIKLQTGAELLGTASQLLGLSLKFDYDSDKGVMQGTYGEKIVIPVNGEQAKPGDPTPNVIIRNYTYGEKVAAGQVFDLDMEVANTSSRQPVENLVMSLETGEGISINSSSNTFYIPKLEAGASQKESVKVQALFQSKLQSPKIIISFKYEYIDKKERKQSSSSETIAIPVYQPDRFEVKEPAVSENLQANQEGTISIPYVNKGRGQIFNVEASLEGEIKALEKTLTLGNFESGKSGNLDFIITPENAGKYDLYVAVSYEDEAMQVKNIKVPVTFTVAETLPMEPEPWDGETDTQSPKMSRTNILAAAAVLLLPVLGICAVLRRKKRAKQQSDPADWDDESWIETDEDSAENTKPYPEENDEKGQMP